jgi:predicted PurR-regulated permease PerM
VPDWAHLSDVSEFMSSQQRAGLLLLLSAVGVVVLVHPFISGLLGALVLTVLASPIYDRMRARRHPRIAAAGVVAGAVLLVVAPAAALLLIAIDQLPEVARWIQESGVRERVAALHLGGADIGGRIAEMGEAALSWLSRRMLNLAGGMVQATINLVIAMFGLYYLLLSGDKLWGHVRSAIPFSAVSTEHLRERFCSVTHATILGTLSIAALQGAVAGLAFWVVGLPQPLVWGVLTAFGAVVPIIGSGLVWIPGTLLLLATQRYVDALMLGAIGAIVVANVDNVARPLIYRRVSRIHPMITLVGAFAGIRYFGVLGVLFGPLGLAYFFEVLTLYRREYGRIATPPEETLGMRPPAAQPPAAQPDELPENRRKEGGGQDNAPVGDGQRHDAKDRRELGNVHGGELKRDDERQRA